jgi:hypothetical protein
MATNLECVPNPIARWPICTMVPELTTGAGKSDLNTSHNARLASRGPATGFHGATAIQRRMHSDALSGAPPGGAAADCLCSSITWLSS